MKSDYHIALERSKVTLKPALRVKDFRLRQSKKMRALGKPGLA